MGLRSILVTAFEPFGGEAINASWEAAKRLDGWRCGEPSLRRECCLAPTGYASMNS
jgi:pyroglutamyl-peptidase